jgi:fructokinase
MMKNRILCIGEILWDLLPAGAKAGGAPMNVALHLLKLGFEVRFAGKVGNDALGDSLRRFLQSNGLDISLLQVDDKLPTSTVVVHLGPDNQVDFEIVDNVAWDQIEFTDDLLDTSRKSDVIIYGTLAARHEFSRNTILSALKNTSGIKLIDVNLRAPYNKKEIVEPLLEIADIAKLNDDELRHIGKWYDKTGEEKELTKWLSDKYKCDLICITRGARGALIYNKGEFHEHPGFKVKVEDTVGSGDAFLAGFLANYLAGKDLYSSLEFACATGALVATRAGATPEYRIDEINEIIKAWSKKQTI